MARRRRAKSKRWPTYQLPAPTGLQVRYGDFDHPGADVGPVAAYADVDADTIYMREPDAFTMGHESFHLLSKLATDRDKARWQKILGYGGDWDQGTGVTGGGLKSPSELIADNFGMLASGRDPRKTMDGGYVEGYDPKRLRRFGRSLERFRARNNLGVYDRKAIRREALKRMAG